MSESLLANHVWAINLMQTAAGRSALHRSASGQVDQAVLKMQSGYAMHRNGHIREAGPLVGDRIIDVVVGMDAVGKFTAEEMEAAVGLHSVKPSTGLG